MLRNAIKDHWTAAQLPIGSYVHAGGFEIRYEANETSAIDPEEVLKLFENEDITRQQFLQMMKISVTDAKNVLGGDQVADFTKTSIGAKIDIRLNDLPVEKVDDEFVMVNANVRKRVKRRVFGKDTTSAKTVTPKRKIKRRIKTKVSR